MRSVYRYGANRLRVSRAPILRAGGEPEQAGEMQRGSLIEIQNCETSEHLLRLRHMAYVIGKQIE